MLPPAPSTTNPGAYLGVVSRVEGARAFVKVRRTAGDGFEYGPARYPDHLAGASTLEGGEVAHTHGIRPLASGDEVAVAFLEGKRDAVVILARLA